jgi:hypothetical protein
LPKAAFGDVDVKELQRITCLRNSTPKKQCSVPAAFAATKKAAKELI